MFVYCSRCAYIHKEDAVSACPVCEQPLLPVPGEYLSKNGNFFISQQKREEFIATVIAVGAEYNAELAANKDAILADKQQVRRAEVDRMVMEYKNESPKLHCPVCGSTNLSAISNLGKVVKISLIGVWGAGDLGKKRRCETCGHRF